MVPQWVKKRPADTGAFWTATRDGLSAGLIYAAHDKTQERHKLNWQGWWWSEPATPPDPPPPQAWDESEAGGHSRTEKNDG